VQVPRAALALLAALLEARCAGLLLPLLSAEAGPPALLPRLLALLDAATRAPGGLAGRNAAS
jgi:hypothetical protein